MHEKTKAKEPYLKPRVTRVSIAPEEMAATGCKTLAGLGRAGYCAKTKCLQVGS